MSSIINHYLGLGFHVTATNKIEEKYFNNFLDSDLESEANKYKVEVIYDEDCFYVMRVLQHTDEYEMNAGNKNITVDVPLTLTIEEQNMLLKVAAFIFDQPVSLVGIKLESIYVAH